MYAEELCFTPKYVRLKQLLDEGALGRADAGQAVGEARRPARAALLGRRALRRRRDDGHGLPRHRVLPLDALGKDGPAAAGAERLRADGHARPRRQDPRRRQRGADPRIRQPGGVGRVHRRGELDEARRHGRPRRVHGSKGVAYADLLHGNAIETYSQSGYGYAVEKAGSHRRAGASRSTRRRGTTASRRRWSTSSAASRASDKPLVTGEDGRAVLEVIFAAYESAGTGRKVTLPFKTDAAQADRPVEEVMCGAGFHRCIADGRL